MILKIFKKIVIRIFKYSFIRNEILKIIKDDITENVFTDNNKKLGTIKNVSFENNTKIYFRDGNIYLGKNTKIGYGSIIDSGNGNIYIGNKVIINDYSILYGNGGLTIGDYTMIAAKVTIISANHKYTRTDIPIQGQGQSKKGIKIGNNSWIGANVTIIDGVTIGNGVVIGAGSVVTKSIPDYSIAVGNPAKVIKKREPSNIIDLKILNKWIIDYIYEQEQQKKQVLIDKIMQFDASKVDFIAEEERAFPGNPEFIKKDYHHKMLKRYFFAAKFFSNNKNVLDSCSGLGWGTFILAHYANKVTAFDLEQAAISFCKKEWDSEKIKWIQGNALDITFLNNEKFDVVTAFETIEHFSKEDGEKYIYEMSKTLNEDGYLIGTSAFPTSEEDAAKLCSTNPYHFHIFTLSEITNILKKYFTELKIIDNWMFIAKK